jgi:hypothetical protein
MKHDRRHEHSSCKAWYEAYGRSITRLGYLVVSGASAETIEMFVSSHQRILSETSFLNKHYPLHFTLRTANWQGRESYDSWHDYSQLKFPEQ